MKKTLMAILLASSFSNAIANDGSQIYFGVLDNSSGSPVLNAVSEVSRSKGELVCWLVKELPAKTPYKVVETFNSPAGSVFERVATVTQINENATEHILAYQIHTNEEGHYMACWGFGNSDPIGLYQHKVQLNGKEFEPNQFQLVQ
ncbi:hypothetical protein [Wielerella bovis]|uniref:hypothetical protein n=1 Tax=Wielerella bovis TaxID=2917790 RepID=UPI002018454E|nr:hypothetical protein [Wielerella bovis]MCG7656104.1 hypothetical protein [Wielerella bovis]MCG7658329.1 hypothetical protein [Wielerella bovis]ULJ64879.1 hypothetical protein MIS33_00750 [Wielerella bovis]ULJ67152.1 hypothetical protein MIS31_00755 [Wielerella bovis]